MERKFTCKSATVLSLFEYSPGITTVITNDSEQLFSYKVM